MKDYGVRVYAQGVDFRMDNRWRDLEGEAFVIPLRQQNWRFQRRESTTGMSNLSTKGLEHIAANDATRLTMLPAFTCRENPREGESDRSRNLRVAQRSNTDLNRFLARVRPGLSGYPRVQECQRLGGASCHGLVCMYSRLGSGSDGVG